MCGRTMRPTQGGAASNHDFGSLLWTLILPALYVVGFKMNSGTLPTKTAPLCVCPGTRENPKHQEWFWHIQEKCEHLMVSRMQLPSSKMELTIR